jgi:hypothetical protein
MEEQRAAAPQARNGFFTIAVASLLTLGGVVGLVVGISELGFSPTDWGTNYRTGLPILVSGALNLLGGTALGFEHRRRAVLFLGLAIVCRALWSVLSQWGWLDTGRGGIEVVGLLLALWLETKSTRPNNSSKPTPLRGAA